MDLLFFIIADLCSNESVVVCCLKTAQAECGLNESADMLKLVHGEIC